MRKNTLLAIFVGAIMLCAGTANAIPVYDGTYVDMYLKQNTFPSGLSEEKIFLERGESTTIFGNVGSQTDPRQVIFSSTTDTLVQAADGFANLRAEDGFINNMTITAPGYWFEDLIFSINLSKDTENMTTTVAAMDMSGGVNSFNGWTLGEGENRILVLSTTGNLMLSVTIDCEANAIESFGGINQLKQTEISGLTSTSVPEPATMLLLGLGLIGLAGIRRKS
jgi:hypothetical protein